MQRVVLFRNQPEESIIKFMLEKNFRKPIALNVHTNSPIKAGSVIKMPSMEQCHAVARRRHVFYFWKHEILVKTKQEEGTFYVWYPESKVQYV